MDVPPPIYAAPAYTGSVVLDVQCFKDDANRYVVKEACAVDVDTGAVLLHHIARPPYPRDQLSADKQRECEWLTRCYHGLDWRHGDIAYPALLDKLRACLHRRYAVYVKGEEKRDFVLDNLVPADANVRELGEIGCGSLDYAANTVRCRHHKSATHRCALNNCVVLRTWMVATAAAAASATTAATATVATSRAYCCCCCCFRNPPPPPPSPQ